jgi:hypothetical protein
MITVMIVSTFIASATIVVDKSILMILSLYFSFLSYLSRNSFHHYLYQVSKIKYFPGTDADP